MHVTTKIFFLFFGLCTLELRCWFCFVLFWLTLLSQTASKAPQKFYGRATLHLAPKQVD